MSDREGQLPLFDYFSSFYQSASWNREERSVSFTTFPSPPRSSCLLCTFRCALNKRKREEENTLTGHSNNNKRQPDHRIQVYVTTGRLATELALDCSQNLAIRRKSRTCALLGSCVTCRCRCVVVCCKFIHVPTLLALRYVFVSEH
jgi:hypothetical protein